MPFRKHGQIQSQPHQKTSVLTIGLVVILRDCDQNQYSRRMLPTSNEPVMLCAAPAEVVVETKEGSCMTWHDMT
jgi:hypothetical protein